MKTPDIFQGTLDVIPDHIPPELVHDFDFLHVKVADPIDFWKELDRQGVPEKFFTPRNGGHWVMRRLNDIKGILGDADRFTNFPVGLPVAPGRPRMIPLEVDPPEHKKYRSVLSPLFTPAAVKRYEARIRAVAVELIEGVVDRGECDFVNDIASKMPPALFLELMGMPVERLPEFLEWEDDLLRGTPEQTNAAAAKIAEYLAEFLAEQAKTPGDNVAGIMIRARDESGAPWNDDELLSASFMLFAAGLDTVTNTLGLIWRYLANAPDARRYIVDSLDDPFKMNCIFHELVRTHTVPTNTRRAKIDFEFNGVNLKVGDVVVLPLSIGNRDPVLVKQADSIDLTREVNPHIAFGYGPHRCLGSALATMEVQVCLREWLTRIPNFEIASGADIKCWVRVIAGMDALPLVWNPS